MINNLGKKDIKDNYPCLPKRAYFDQYGHELKWIFTIEHEYLTDLNIELLQFFIRQFQMRTQLVSTSVLVDANTSGAEKIMSILNALEAKENLIGTGAGSKRYLDESLYEKNNIKLF